MKMRVIPALAALMMLCGCAGEKIDGGYNVISSDAAGSVTESSEQSEVSSEESAQSVTESSTEESSVPAGGEPEESSVTESSGNSESSENQDDSCEWAVYLVDRNHPLADGFDDQVNLTVGRNDDRKVYMDSRAAVYFNNMVAAAKADGVNVIPYSGFRTFEYQRQVFDRSVQSRVDGGMSREDAIAETKRNVAQPKESEHNTGLAMDVVTDGIYGVVEEFEDTEAFRWLSEHAHEYGFILSYPKGKTEQTGYIYEPWHYRFVGVKCATDMKNKGFELLEDYLKS